MPRQQLMSWEGEPYFRWVKMYKGTRYRVSCDELRATRTKEGSIVAANDWWTRKRYEVDTPPQRTREEELLAQEVQRLKRIEEALPHVEQLKQLEEAHPPTKGTQAKLSERSIQTTAERFLELAQGEVKPLTLKELRGCLGSLYGRSGPLLASADVSVLNEDQVEKIYIWLRDTAMSASQKKKKWSFFKRFVKYLWEKRLLELPRNLNSFSFEVKAKKIKTYSISEVRQVLDTVKPRFKLYALLGLNCSMTSVDMGMLTKSMVDLKRGTLTRKRVKTEGHEDVPVVTYKLWPETLALLKDQQADHPTLVLTSADNTPLWSSTIKGDKIPTYDLISKGWQRGGVAIPLKAFRSISATLIGSHPTYGRLTTLFLGHSPRTLAEKHYVAPSQELFDECMSWLHEQIYTLTV